MNRNAAKNILEGLLMAAPETLTLQQLFQILNSEIKESQELLNSPEPQVAADAEGEGAETVESPLEVLPQPETEKQVKKLLFEINEIKDMIAELICDYAGRGIELKEVATGYRFQVRADLCPWISKLFEERPPRYSRAFMETLALIAYKQPITRAEIEDVRGVTVSTNIMKTLQEHEWIRVVGYKEVPGKPALFATTDKFLNHFNIKSLADLPPLMEFTADPEVEPKSETENPM